MPPIEREHRSTVGTLRVLARWGLLGAVIAAMLALHVLTAEHTPDQHGGIPAMPADSHVVVQLYDASDVIGGEPAAAGSLAGGFEHSDGSGELLLGCILFLVVVGPAVLLALLRSRRAVGSTPAAGRAPVHGLLTPAAPAAPRIALCVMRT